VPAMPSSPAVLAGGQLRLLRRSEVAVAGAAAEDLPRRSAPQCRCQVAWEVMRAPRHTADV
jgi:hypothetical protein